jgi:hypothetical protein
VAVFYGLDSFLFFQTDGIAAPVLVKLLICGVGVYFCSHNVMCIKKSSACAPPANTA